MNIHPDAIVVIMMAFGFLFGYIFGRIERKEAYVTAYKRGKEIGISVGRVQKTTEMMQEEYRDVLVKRIEK